MSRIRKFFMHIPAYILWAFFAAVLWLYVFNFVTDTSADRKVVLFAEVDAMESEALAIRLEEEKPDNIRMVQARPFSYAMFSADALTSADLYIVPEAHVSRYFGSFAASGAFHDAHPELYARDFGSGVYGYQVYDAAAGTGIAPDYITYTTEGAVSDYYLFFGTRSLHVSWLYDAVDNAAADMALRLLQGFGGE